MCICVVQMLAVDLSILVSEGDMKGLESDSDSINRQSVGQWEAELLQERLQELQPTGDAESADSVTKV